MKNHFIHSSVTLLTAVFLIAGCSTKTKLKKVETSSISFKSTENGAEDKAIAAYIEPYKKKMDAEMNAVLIISENAMVKDLPESSLGNMVSDIVLKKASEKYNAKFGKKVDMVLLNNGGLRTSFPKGEITKGKVFELMPFENEIVVLTLSGEKTQQLFDYIAHAKGMPVAGIKMGIKDTIPTNVLIGGIPFDNTKTYTVATSDYLSAGGDKMRFFNNPIKIDNVGYKLRDALIDYMVEENAKGNKLNSKKDGRIYIEK